MIGRTHREPRARRRWTRRRLAIIGLVVGVAATACTPAIGGSAESEAKQSVLIDGVEQGFHTICYIPEPGGTNSPQFIAVESTHQVHVSWSIDGTLVGEGESHFDPFQFPLGWVFLDSDQLTAGKCASFTLTDTLDQGAFTYRVSTRFGFG